MADEEQDEKTIAQDLVVTKYKMAAEITNCNFLKAYFIVNKMSELQYFLCIKLAFLGGVACGCLAQ